MAVSFKARDYVGATSADPSGRAGLFFEDVDHAGLE
jgi:hypothetical protein